MSNNRRQFIKKLFTYGTYGLVLSNGLLHSTLALAFKLPKRLNNNFKARKYEETLSHLFGDATLINSPKIKFSRLPYIAENGAAVPITIASSIENITKISILVEHNPYPLIAEFHLLPATVPIVSARIKMAKTSKVIVIVEAEGKFYRKVQKVKVTVGGCS